VPQVQHGDFLQGGGVAGLQPATPFAAAAARLDEIPGIGPVAAAIIIAEAGTGMTRFPTPGHLASWAKFAPRGQRVSREEERPRRYRARRPMPGPRPGRSRHRRPPAPAPSSARLPPHHCPSRPPAITTWDPASTTPASRPAAPCATTSASPKPSAPKSPWKPPPDQPLHLTRLRCAPPGAAACPTGHRFSDHSQSWSAAPVQAAMTSWVGLVVEAFGSVRHSPDSGLTSEPSAPAVQSWAPVPLQAK
jgi:hypothetical protein